MGIFWPKPAIDDARCRDASAACWGPCQATVLALLEGKNDYPGTAREVLDLIYERMNSGLDQHLTSMKGTFSWCCEAESYLEVYLTTRDTQDTETLRNNVAVHLEKAPAMTTASLKSIENSLLAVNDAIGHLAAFRVAINNNFVVRSQDWRAQRNKVIRKLDAAETCFQATKEALERARNVLKRDSHQVNAIQTCSRIVHNFIRLNNRNVPQLQAQSEMLLGLCRDFIGIASVPCSLF
ncbi:hypothetical protein SPRG_13009 [Saprolegnia parasitica CBS 223.65]|uniref:Uncharacterized protein n=1 Tax=Saprolegnia parasitica (strain CBS 223.65) TaxID=695850 RepID=A0A067C583_SAPPC|nr:hypothetical protein SPRG_13009 [Saprolegnia parasitica CBS 223.65]KDO21671.1 hypothetical protein SPRG_13009 [Saprolegnia parasitica CBS 223.65]|eukprot:XP_012207595.1 hypothetical protein SPRG_13009 [Saprolegnia parasitica CBS 223.65]